MKLLLCLFLAMISLTAQSATLNGAKQIGAVFGNQREVVRVIYDYSKDAGATGDYTMLTAVDDCLVRMIGSKSIAAITSSGSATIDVGVGTTGQEFEAAGAYASYSLNAFIAGDSAPFVKVSDGSVINLGVNTAVLTAGKVEFIFEVVKF